MPLEPTAPTTADPVIDADLVARLAAAVPAEALAPDTQARIKHRLLRRIAAEQMPQHKTVLPDATGWEPLGPGLTMKRLHETGGVLSYLVRLAPGAVLAAHRHPVDEECVVLEGEMLIGEHRVGPGGFHLGRAGVLHDRIRSGDAGALVFLRGAAPELATLI